MEKAADLGRPLEGVAWMLACGLCFVGLTGLVRAVGTDLPAPQQAFLRFAFVVPFLVPGLLPQLRAGLPAGAWRLFLGRGVVHVAAVIFWFYAMARLPVAEVTAIGYLNPVVMIVAGAVVFGERLTAGRIAALGVALAGALVILRPGWRELGTGQAAQVAAAICFAGSYLFAKRLSLMLPASVVVAMLSLTAAVGLAPLALWSWVPVTAAQAAMLAGTAVLGTAAHYCMTRAFRAAPLSVTQPVTFLQIVWATLLGHLVFAEAIDPWTILGGGLIVAAVSLSATAEAARARSAARAVAPEA